MKRIGIIFLLALSIGVRGQVSYQSILPQLSSSATVIYTSSAGLVSDADLSMEPTTVGTDNTAALEAILSQASDTSPLLVVVDGKYSATKIRLRSNTHLYLLPGCGFVQRPNSNVPFVTNANRSGTTYGNKNIVIEGYGGIINGNGWVGTTPQHTKMNTGESGVGFYCPILCWAGVQNVTVKGVTLRNGRTYASFANNFDGITYRDVLIEQNPNAPAGQNQDGADFVGPFTRLRVENLTGYAKDDLFSVANSYGSRDYHYTVVDGGVEVDTYYAYASAGDAMDFYAAGLDFRGCMQGFRILSSGYKIQGTIQNVKGYITGSNIAIIDNYSMGGTNPTDIWSPNGVYTGNGVKLIIDDIHVAVGYGSQYGDFYVGMKGEIIKITNFNKFGNSASNNCAVTFGPAANFKQAVVGVRLSNNFEPIPDAIQVKAGARIDVLDVSGSTYDKSEMTGGDVSSGLVRNEGTIGVIKANNVTMLKTSPMVRYVSGSLGAVVGSNIYMNALYNAAPTYPEGSGACVEVASGVTLPELYLSNTRTSKTHIGAVTTTKGDAFTP